MTTAPQRCPENSGGPEGPRLRTCGVFTLLQPRQSFPSVLSLPSFLRPDRVISLPPLPAFLPLLSFTRAGLLVGASLLVGLMAPRALAEGIDRVAWLQGCWETSDAKVVFENAAHDFPQRVGYESTGADQLLKWVEGSVNGRERRIEFAYRRVACP